ncbi:MAG: DUF4845 domain-containing protein [Thiobacillus sp.]
MHKQRGVSMFGFMLVAIVVIIFAMLAMKLVPAYIEYFSVKKILNAMGQDSEMKSMNNADIRSAFAKRADVGYVTVVKPSDLNIDRSGGNLVISTEYEYRTPLVANISLIVDFKASSNPASLE